MGERATVPLTPVGHVYLSVMSSPKRRARDERVCVSLPGGGRAIRPIHPLRSKKLLSRSQYVSAENGRERAAMLFFPSDMKMGILASQRLIARPPSSLLGVRERPAEGEGREATTAVSRD